MTNSTSTADGFPIRCEVCGTSSSVDVSRPPGDSVCPNCGAFLWVDALSEATRRESFVPDVRLPNIGATSREAVIRQMIDALAAHNGWSAAQVEQCLRAILKREELGPTGIGRGFAIPHASLDFVERCTSAMALVPEGVEFDALDGKPVYTVIMVVSPLARPGDHLRTLERISRALRMIGRSSP